MTRHKHAQRAPFAYNSARMKRARAGIGAALLLAVACGGATGGNAPSGEPTRTGTTIAASEAERPASCPAQAAAPAPLPNVLAAHRRLAYWLERAAEDGDIDEVLLAPSEIRDHNRGLGLPVGRRALGQMDLLAPPDRSALLEDVQERVAFVRGRLAEGLYVERDGSSATAATLALFDTPSALPARAPELRIATGDIPLRCAPREAGFYTPSLDLAFDRNNCSTVHAQEPVQVLGASGEGLWLVRTRYALGWMPRSAPLSPVVPAELAEAVVRGVRTQLTRDASVTTPSGATVALAAGALLPATPEGSQVIVASPEAVEVAAVPGLVSTERPLTRRSLLEAAFSMLDAPYGWGGHEGGRDCSRFLLDTFETFGLGLPRHSGRQALAGTFSIDVDVVDNGSEKLLLIDAAAKKGVVLLHFPGHIMLYLGRTEDGTPMAIHAFSEYVMPCAGVTGAEGEALETLNRVDRVTVSDLTLGANSSRGSFLERIARIVVLGHAPGVELRGAATFRAAAPVDVPADRACDDSNEVAIFRSPHRPYPGQPLRVVVTSSEDPGPIDLTLLDPEGARVEVSTHRLGGPPYTYWAEVERPMAGQWTAVLGDGSRIEACERFYVVRYPPREDEPRAVEGPAWVPSWSWERDTENLYSAFVEQLFTDPVDEEATWSSLSELLNEPSRNLLYNHRSLGEDERVHLEPDCADLPYFLRAYFSWKLRLPFGFRQCTRGRSGRAPACGEPRTNLDSYAGRDEVEAFTDMIRHVGRAAHSASARTHPNDDGTDNYPVALTRETLQPGTVFADPFGHLLVIAGWRAQGVGDYGVLVGADAQPDGTVGRRRFWRGSFLFTPDTADVGAGFKAWRPLVYDRAEETITILDNEALRGTGDYPRWSDQQYRGTADDFYDRMEGLINPRALDPVAMQLALVDALEESVVRRVVSVDNGERFMAARGFRPIEMPEGLSIFQTSGPWEDFSTPSRDMRLLISLDAVTDFPRVVEQNPARFGVDEAAAPTVAADVRSRLEDELGRRRFSYTRSDGSTHELTLADVVGRAEAFEMAYNPNDCVERRWAAPEGSGEATPCRRHAAVNQRGKMDQYRDWFRTRQRPAR